MKPSSPGNFRRLAFVAAFAAVGVAFASAAEPWLRTSIAEPAAGTWRRGQPLIVRVDLGVRGDDVPADGLRFAPAGTTAPAVTLELTNADGSSMPVDWRPSDGIITEPLTVVRGQRRSFYFALTEPGRNLLAAGPGRYALRATLQIGDGAGWRGRITAAPLPLTIAGAPLPDVRVVIPSGGEIAPGDPLLVAVTFAATPEFGSGDTFQTPDFSEKTWRERFELGVTDPAGKPAAWAFAEPIVSSRPGERQLRAGKTYGPVFLRVPAAATAGVRPGAYALVARLKPIDGGAVETSPVTVRVLAADAAGTFENRSASVALALNEARLLRERAQAVRSFLGWQDRLFTEAAATLARVEPLAAALVRERPESARAALLQASVAFAREDRTGAAAAADRAAATAEGQQTEFATVIAGLRARLAEPATETERFFEPHWRRAVAGNGSTSSPSALPAAITAPALPQAPHPVAPVINLSNPVAPPTTSGAGQWAIAARASSEYRATDYSAVQATGAPNVARHGDNGKAWAAKAPDAGEEWLELTFARAVHATGVRVVQSFNPGAIVRIDVLDAAGATTTVWRGPDATVYAKNDVGILAASFPRTAAPVAKVKLVLDAKAVAGWNEIDAVELLADAAAE